MTTPKTFAPKSAVTPRSLLLAAALAGAVVPACSRSQTDTAPTPEKEAVAPDTANRRSTPTPTKAEATARTVPSPTPAKAAAGSLYNYSYRRVRDNQIVTPVADDCTTPYVDLATSPNTDWNWIRHAMIAHPEFTDVGGAPATSPMEVSFVQFASSSYRLVASCADGATCNKLAAMYLNVVWASTPKVQCKTMEFSGSPKKVRVVTTSWMADLTATTEYVPKCARLNACDIRMNPKSANEVGRRCQGGPNNFKLECALQESCDDVVACANRR